MDKIDRISDLDLERYNCGEVTPEERREIEAALAADPRLAAELEKIRKSDREIRETYVFEDLPAGRERKKILLFSAPARWIMGAAAAVLLVLFLPRIGGTPGDETDRVKGADELSVYLKTEGIEEKVDEHTVLREGNTIQLAYTVTGERYGVIFSIDGRSVVTMHYPYSLRGDTKLVSGKRTALAEAYTLDDAPDCEIFFFVIGRQPLQAPEILRAAESLAGDPKTAAAKGRAAFKNYDLKTITLAKE